MSRYGFLIVANADRCLKIKTFSKTFFLLVTVFAAASLYISTDLTVRISSGLMHAYYELPWK